MAFKILNKIHQFSQNDLIEFLRNNGYAEFEKILIDGDITDGKKFLEMNELQIQRWHLEKGTKMKLLSFVEEVKVNPQKYYDKVANEKHPSLQRKQSFVGTNKGFIKELQQVIIPKPTTNPISITRTSRKPLPPPPPLEDSELLEEYLDMNQGTKQTNLHVDEEVHYDANGYLLPLNPKEEKEEENDYEPPPSTRNFLHENTVRISQRPPLAIPRDSTDDRGYILGPKISPSLLPRVQNKNNTRSNIHSTQQKPDFQNPPKITVQDENEEEASYEPIDDYEPDGESSQISIIPEDPRNKLTKLFGFMKVNKKPERNIDQEFKTNSLERNNQHKKVTTKLSSPLSRSVEKEFSIRNRPLPPLPSRQQIFHTQNSEPFEDFSSRVYENAPKQTEKPKISVPKSLPSPVLKNKKSTPKSPSNDQNIQYINSRHVPAEDEIGMTYENIGKVKPKFPESYETYTPKKSTLDSRTLPLPPKNILPQIPLDPNLIHKNIHGEEDCTEDYDSCIFNLNNERFYRNTDRKGARQYLEDLEEGAFLFRPSKKFFLTLSLKYDNKYINLGIEKTSNNRIRLFTEDSISPEFVTLDEFVNHFTKNILTFRHQGSTAGVYLKPVLSQY